MTRHGRRTALICAGILWAATTAYGFSKLWEYSARPGVSAEAPSRWPSASSLSPSPTLPTLVVAIHPRCACSRATLRELARLMARARGRFAAYAVFVNPDGDEEWAATDLWSQAAAIPGVRVVRDDGDVEVRRFGAETSGQVFLYAPDGRLVFQGGITPGRGHSGDNFGESSILAIVAGGRAARTEAPVFGCHLREER